MTQDQEIADLLAQAEPLRLLEDDDPAKAELGPLVDRINALRNPPLKATPPPDIDPEAEAFKATMTKSLGRPRKAVA